ncbi:hypothetical protein LOTGIDRAFT_154970 [Lottia gigantea]|uniref:Uncharacterized protein n=1 Tax=Lottia gigantea TaxID=225164 RepID=V3ZSE9_LOTGI|nr:hypothetical protein LOTGIDRAFT_154970 [Lottia gigantea]ESO85480.1 hypothetical protein LOTGIDRAFT_154970 [Lottia gigantea]
MNTSIEINDDETFIENRKRVISNIIKAVSNKFLTVKGQIEIDGEIFQDGKHKQFMKLLGFNAKTFHTIFRNMEEKSDPSDSISDAGLFAWDCETYSESETRKAIHVACTLINLEKLKKMLDRINNLFPDLNPTDNVPEEFYNKLMNIVEIFVGNLFHNVKLKVFHKTDSLYISSRNWDKLNRAGLVSENEYCKGKNDYGDGGIIFGLYLAPNVKYNIILTSDGVLKEKKTFKGYFNNKTSVEDYIQLASGHDVTNEFNKRWERSFTNGVVIPKDDDKQKKVFRSYLNLVKRKPPNSEGLMFPYSYKDKYSFDENYEFDDSDYIYIQEESD